MDKDTYILEMNSISKSFGGIQALKNATLQVKAGTVHALLGENGAGKSTLMKILAGIHQADSGEIVMDGNPVEIDSVVKAIDCGIAMIHQELSFIPELSVAENIYIGSEPIKKISRVVDKKCMNAMAAEIFGHLGLSINPGARMGDLSIAEKQMVEIAKAVSKNAKILVMDEPTSAITDREVEHLFKIIADLKAKGTAVIYISHKLDEIFRISDMITVLRDGNIIDTLPAAKLDEEKLVPMLVGRTVEDFYYREPRELGEVVLEVRNFSRKGKFENINFSLHRGEILGIAGLMGAGRTEIVETIFGISQPSSGECLINGAVVKIRSPRDAIRLGLGFIPEDRKVHGLNTKSSIRYNLTLVYLKNLCYGGKIISSGREKTVSAELIKNHMIKTENDENPIQSLSGGNQQKVVIAKWLMGAPDILILDDPTRGIDVGAKAEIHKLMNELAKQGKAIIMISSEMPEVLGVSDRVLVIREGRLSGEFKEGEFDSNQIIRCAMGIQ